MPAAKKAGCRVLSMKKGKAACAVIQAAEKTMDTIYKNPGPFGPATDLDFLSNEYPSDVEISVTVKDLCRKQLVFPCAGSAYQAFKCPQHAEEFTTLGGWSAWRHGREIPLRADWEEVKENIMACVIAAKFTSAPALFDRLMQTQGRIIMENAWNDTYWGVCNGIGENRLGKLLEQFRNGASQEWFYCH